MTNQQLINDITKRRGAARSKLRINSAKVRAVLEATIQAVKTALAGGERVVFSGMGVFTIHASKQRTRMHPVTRGTYTSKATRRIKFRPSKSFRSESCG